jgi:hypothetical protein
LQNVTSRLVFYTYVTVVQKIALTAVVDQTHNSN